MRRIMSVAAAVMAEVRRPAATPMSATAASVAATTTPPPPPPPFPPPPPPPPPAPLASATSAPPNGAPSASPSAPRLVASARTMRCLLIDLITIPSPGKTPLSFGPKRSGNAISASAFHHLRDCDAALHRRRDRSRPQQWLRLSISDLARPYGGNQINRRTKCRRSHHDSVRGRLLLTLVNRVPRGVVVDATASTVARMPQGKAKSGFPHEPPRPRLPLDHRFGMLRPGVRVVVEAVTMR